MKKLSPDLIEKIADFEAESTLSLRGYALEKDYFVTDVLALIRSMPPNPDFRWVFCGGTSLAKAFGIVQRMSENLDFKLIPAQAQLTESKCQLRRKLSACADQVMVAFPRRLAQHLANASPTQPLSIDSGWDTALVRHIYDVYQMIQSDPGLAQADVALIQTVGDVIAQDAQEFYAQFPGFSTDPWGHIQNALNWAESSPVLEDQYASFVSDMVYAPQEHIPTYRQALDVFSQSLIATMP